MPIRVLRFKVKNGLEVEAPSGLPPLVVDSTLLNENLNADLLDGQHGSYYATDSLVVHKAGDETITGSKLFQSQAINQTILSVQGAAGQGETPYFVIKTSGDENIVAVNDTLVEIDRSIEVFPTAASDVALTIKSLPSQTADLQQWLDASNEILARIDAAGHFFVDKITTESDVVIGGNLTVNGTTTTIHSIIATVQDPVLVLGGDTPPTTPDYKDRGIEFYWHDGVEPRTGFFGFDESTKRFTYIPYAQNDGEVFSGNVGGLDADHIQFPEVSTSSDLPRRFRWDDYSETVSLGLTASTSMDIGQHFAIKVYNNSGTTLLKGTAVYVDGINSSRISVNKLVATENAINEKFLGLVAENIAAGQSGFVFMAGESVSSQDFSAMTEGDELWVSETTAGALTNVRPVAPNKAIRVGYLQEKIPAGGARIYVQTEKAPSNLETLNDVSLSTIADWDIVRYDQDNSRWTNTDISTVINALDTINAQNIIISNNLTVDNDAWIKGDLDVDGDINFDGGDITTSSTIVNLVNGTATDIYFGGAATNIQIGASSGTTNVNNDLDVDGDVNIDGGDLTASTSTFNLLNTTVSTLNIGGAATDIQIGSSSGTTNINNDLNVDGDELSTTSGTFTLISTPTIVNFATSATTLEIGGSTGTTNINNDLEVDGDITVDGGDFKVTTSIFNLANDTATTVNFAGAATDIQIGAATGITNVNNDLDVDGDVNVDGGDLTTNLSSFNLLNTNAQTINFGGAATSIEIGAATGTTNINNDADIDGNLNVDGGSITSNLTNFNLLKTNVTTLDFAQAATNITMGATTGTTTIRNDLNVDGDVSIDGGDLSASTTSFNLFNDTVTTMNFAGSASVLSIGADSGTTTVNNNLTVKDVLTIEGTTTNFNPPTVSAPFTLGTNALQQLVTGLNSDYLDGQHGAWYQDRTNHTGQQEHTTISDWTEAVNDTVAPMFVHSQNVGIVATYNDISGRVILQVTNTGGGVGANFPITYWMGV